MITGDDFGAVSVYKICRNDGQGGFQSSRTEADGTDDGFMNENLKMSPADEGYQQWRQDEAKTLSEILTLKASSSGSVPAAPVA